MKTQTCIHPDEILNVTSKILEQLVSKMREKPSSYYIEYMRLTLNQHIGEAMNNAFHHGVKIATPPTLGGGLTHQTIPPLPDTQRDKSGI